MPMKIFKYAALSVVSISAICILLITIMNLSERPKSEFENYYDAKASGFMDKGWIPTFIPLSAKNIKEQHDLDTNWVKMTFTYEPGDVENTRSACDSEKKIDGGIEFKCVYFENNVSIKLFNDGQAELYSSRN
jgi:hypothetical protein